jgi:CheY-like chemotaxis protein
VTIKPRVLVVDDETLIRVTLGDALELEGYDCRLAANGLEALSVLSEWHADLIVLDLTMPVMDGWAFRRAQHATLALREIPVLVITAGRGHYGRDAELAAAAILAKPFELDELIETVQLALGVRPKLHPVA